MNKRFSNLTYDLYQNHHVKVESMWRNIKMETFTIPLVSIICRNLKMKQSKTFNVQSCTKTFHHSVTLHWFTARISRFSTPQEWVQQLLFNLLPFQLYCFVPVALSGLCKFIIGHMDTERTVVFIIMLLLGKYLHHPRFNSSLIDDLI